MGRISPKFEHLPWLALIVPPTPFHRRRRHFSSLPTSSPTLQFRRERPYFRATIIPMPIYAPWLVQCFPNAKFYGY